MGKDNVWKHYIDLQIFIRDLLHFKKAFVSDRHKFDNLLKLAQNYKLFDPSEGDQFSISISGEGRGGVVLLLDPNVLIHNMVFFFAYKFWSVICVHQKQWTICVCSEVMWCSHFGIKINRTKFFEMSLISLRFIEICSANLDL